MGAREEVGSHCDNGKLPYHFELPEHGMAPMW
jgi:hypothetical protein